MPVRCSIASEMEGEIGYSRFRKNPKKSEHTYIKKYTVEDSLKSTVLVLTAGEDFKAEVLKYAKEKRRQKVHFHPVMGVFFEWKCGEGVCVVRQRYNRTNSDFRGVIEDVHEDIFPLQYGVPLRRAFGLPIFGILLVFVQGTGYSWMESC